MDQPIRIGIMGFGRVARNLIRILYRNDSYRIAAISDPVEHRALEYLLNFDTILGPFPDELSVTDGHIYVAGQRIPVLEHGEPKVPWGDYGVDVVVAASSQPRTRAELESHLEHGAKRVVLCVPPKESPDITVVMGVNDDRLTHEHRIVSNASCTAHCIVPVLKILDDAFGVERAFLSSVHAYGAHQRLADVPSEDPRRGRAAAENIIPQDTNVGALIDDLLPELAGRVTAQAISVPVPNGSVVDLVCWHREKVDETAINEVVRTAAAASWEGLLCYEDRPIVSTDVAGSVFSGTFDSLATMVMGDSVSKTLCWYDNSWGYTHRAIELVARLAELDEVAA